MFGFFRRPAPRPLSDAVTVAIAHDPRREPLSNPSDLRMVESRGQYSDRKVTFFRVFDPASAAQRATGLLHYKDFDAFPGLILRSGHVESDGVVVLSRPVVVLAATTSSRTEGDRTLHADDAHIVRGETGASANLTTGASSLSGRTR